MTPWVWLLRLWCNARHRSAYAEDDWSRITCPQCGLVCEQAGGRQVWTWQPGRRRRGASR